ncbi:MAG: cation-translocating P-type ATPase C-terminal domain-containing protein [Nitrosomonas sp.]|nr:cation-translocating P-type ATPase C-terminal domain-containing protein [Nitrosomonas sp.]
MKLLYTFSRNDPWRSPLVLVSLILAAAAEGFGLSTLLPLLSLASNQSIGEHSALGNLMEPLLLSAGFHPSTPILLFVIFAALIIKSIAAMAAFFYVLHSGGWYYGQMLPADNPLYLQATTACLSAIIVMQIMNVFICRHPSESVFHSGWFGNRLLLIVYTPLGNHMFGTAPIEIDVWLYAIPFCLVMPVLDELRKARLR